MSFVMAATGFALAVAANAARSHSRQIALALASAACLGSAITLEVVR